MYNSRSLVDPRSEVTVTSADDRMSKLFKTNVYSTVSALGRLLQCESGSGLLSIYSLLGPAAETVSFFNLLSSCFSTVS